MRTRLPALLAAAVLALVLVGCNPDGVADDRYGGIPEGVAPPSGEGDVTSPEPYAAWLSPGERFAVVTYGSSSCPAQAASIEVADAASVVVTFESPIGAGPCTADLAPTTHEFELPQGASERPLEVTIAWTDYEGRSTSVLE